MAALTLAHAVLLEGLRDLPHEELDHVAALGVTAVLRRLAAGRRRLRRLRRVARRRSWRLLRLLLRRRRRLLLRRPCCWRWCWDLLCGRSWLRLLRLRGRLRTRSRAAGGDCRRLRERKAPGGSDVVCAAARMGGFPGRRGRRCTRLAGARIGARSARAPPRGGDAQARRAARLGGGRLRPRTMGVCIGKSEGPMLLRLASSAEAAHSCVSCSPK